MPTWQLFQKLTLRSDACSNPLSTALRIQRLPFVACPILKVLSAYCKCDIRVSWSSPPRKEWIYHHPQPSSLVHPVLLPPKGTRKVPKNRLACSLFECWSLHQHKHFFSKTKSPQHILPKPSINQVISLLKINLENQTIFPHLLCKVNYVINH